MSHSTVPKMAVCQKCGDRGDIKYLVYCIKCQISSEHRYCLDILPEEGDKNVMWTCEECSPRDTKPKSTPSIKSARISQAAEIKRSRIKMWKQTSFSKVNAQANRNADKLTNIKKPTGDCSPEKEIERLPNSCDGSPKKEIERLPNSCDGSLEKEIERLPSLGSLGNEEFRKPKRRLVLEVGNSDDELETARCSEVKDPLHLHPPTSAHSLNIFDMSCSEANDFVHAQPISDPIWRGCFNIQNNKNLTYIGLLAHLSSKACARAAEAAKQLPMQLNVAIFSRADAWPQKFEIAPPTYEDIALFFFPANERDENFYDNLMNELIIHDQALKAVVNNVELLVFSSRELPPEHWRFCSKYYIWGVFNPTNIHVPEKSFKNLFSMENNF